MFLFKVIACSFTLLLGGCLLEDVESKSLESGLIEDVSSGGEVVVIEPSALEPVSLGGVEYQIATHPRIFVDGPEGLRKLRAKAVSGNPFWEAFSSQASADLSSEQWSGQIMAGHALMYLVDPVTYAQHGDKAREMLLASPEHLADRSYAASEVYRHNVRKLAMTYDWIFPLLSVEDKAGLTSWFDEELEPFMWTHPITSGGNVQHNIVQTHITALGLWGVATYGDSERAEEYIDYYYDNWVGALKPLLDVRYVGGHTYSGSAYGYNRTWRYAVYNLLLLRSAFGINQIDDSPWVSDVIDYFKFAHLPGTVNSMYSDGNVGGGTFSARTLESLLISMHAVSGSSKSKEGAYYLKEIVQPSANFNDPGLYINKMYRWKWFLWSDPALPVQNSMQGDTGYLASGVDVWFSRTDWSDSATHVSFAAADWIGDHQAANPGSYKIWKGEHLIYENSTDGSGQKMDTNMLVLDDGIVERSYGQLVETGGFDYETRTAEITDSYFSATYNYAKADLGGSYVDNSNAAGSSEMRKLENFTREIVHLKAIDAVIIFDRIKSIPGAATQNGQNTGGEVRKSHQFYVPKIPAVQGATVFSGNLVTNKVIPPGANIQAVDVTDNTSLNDDVWKIELFNPTATSDENVCVVHSFSGFVPEVSAVNGNTVVVDGWNVAFGAGAPIVQEPT